LALNKSTMKILITGGAGYIGSHTIIEFLERTDFQIVSVDNHANSSPDSYKRITEITERNFEHYNVDLCDKAALAKVYDEHKFDGVMHFAALKAVGESVEQPARYYQNNVIGLLNILELQVAHGIRDFIFSSSCTVYGNATKLPVTELHTAGQAESPYGQTKVMGEQILRDISAQGEIKVLALRYFNPVGAHKSGRIGELPLGVPNNLIPYVTQTAAGIREELTIYGSDYETRDGTCIRDYVHVSDIARAHVLGMSYLLNEKQNEQFDFINLGTGNGVSVKEVVDTFQSVNGVSLAHKYGPRRAGDIMSMYADNTKASLLLDWSPEIDLEEMMRSAWAWQLHLDNHSL
jgi:UDP-glucose 4-epimerase